MVLHLAFPILQKLSLYIHVTCTMLCNHWALFYCLANPLQTLTMEDRPLSFLYAIASNMSLSVPVLTSLSRMHAGWL